MRISDWSSDVCSSDLVEAERALVAVHAEVVAGVAALVEGRPPVAHLVALRRLDLDDVGAVVAEQLRAVRPAEHAGAVDDLEAGECAALISGVGHGIPPCGIDRKSTRLNSRH